MSARRSNTSIRYRYHQSYRAKKHGGIYGIIIDRHIWIDKAFDIDPKSPALKKLTEVFTKAQ
jgi:hypothetical protein